MNDLRFAFRQLLKNPGFTAVAVASYSLWQRLGGADDFLGGTIRVNDVTYTVIGIAPKGFAGTTAVLGPEAWLPLGMASTEDASGETDANRGPMFDERQPVLLVFAQLQPGLSLQAAQARMEVIDRRLNALSGQPARELVLTRPSRAGISNWPMSDSVEAVLGPVALAMAAAVLVIASLNLANLLLARGLARRKEIAIRLSLGASRGRVVRQLVLEGLLLAWLGGGLGLLLSVWSDSLLLRNLVAQFHSTPFSIALELSPDARVLAATLGYSVLAVLVFSLVPAWRSTRLNLVSDLKLQVGATTDARGHQRFFSLRHCLVMGQVALSLMLLFCTGLFLRSLLKASQLDLGFDPRNRLLAEIDYTVSRTAPDKALQRQRAVLERVRELPGVTRAALATQTPYASFNFSRGVRPAGADEHHALPAINTAVTQGYFETLGIPLLQGRDFTETEGLQAGGPRVAIIDETLARRLFAERDAVGLRVVLDGETADHAGLEVVGVIRSPRHHPNDEAQPRRIYLPLGQASDAHVYLHVGSQPGGSAGLGRRGHPAGHDGHAGLLASRTAGGAGGPDGGAAMRMRVKGLVVEP